MESTSDLGLDKLAVQLVSGVAEHLAHTAGLGEGDEAEAPAPAGGWVLHDHHLGGTGGDIIRGPEPDLTSATSPN